MKRLRRWFAITTLTLLGAFTAFVLLCAALLPKFESTPEDEGRRLVRLGFRLTDVRYEKPRFAGDRFVYDRVECYEHPSGDRHLIARIVLRSGDSEGAPVRPDVQAAVGILAVAMLPDAGEIAISRREAAITTPRGILRRRADGRWENASGGALPPELARLSLEATLDERLSHPDRVVWLDAAIESCLHRLDGRIFADALLRGSELPLLRLLLLSGDRNEIARVAVETEDPVLQLQLLDELTREDRTDAFRRICARRWATEQTSPYLRTWLIDRLEDGTFEALSDRRSEFRRLAQVADASCRARLRRIVEEQDGVACAAAYLILRRHLDREPDAAIVPEAKRWIEK